MVRTLIGGVGVGLAAVAWATAAQAQEFTAYFSCSTQISNGAITTVYSSGIFKAPHEAYSARDFAKAFKEHLISQGLDAPYANCSNSTTTERAFRSLDNAENHALKMKARFRVVNWAPSRGKVIARGAKDTSPKEPPAKTADRKSSDSSTRPAPASEQEPSKTRAEYEAEWQAELDKYAADKAAWEAKIEAQELAEERKNAAHAAAQEKAALAKAAHEKKMDAHRRELEEANRRQQEYFAAQRRHALCVNGERQWCEGGAGEHLADAGEASTDTDATTCVSRPVVSANATFEGNTAAMVVNGCETTVDVRICLMREGGWNCGVTWGLQPQERWSHSSFKATGEIFWDARVAGSSEPLASPGGS